MGFVTIELHIHIGGSWVDEAHYIGGDVHRHLLNDTSLSLGDLCQVLTKLGYEFNNFRFTYFRDAEKTSKVVVVNDVDVIALVDFAKISNCLSVYVDDKANADAEAVATDDDDEEEDDDEDDDDDDDDDDVDVDPTMYLPESDEDDVGDIRLYLGQRFFSKETFKKAIFKYAMENKFNVRYTKSEKKKVQACCSNQGCEWKLYGSKNSASDMWRIRSYHSVHTCSWDGHVKILNARKIADYFLNDFRLNPDLSAKQMKERLSAQKIHVSKDKCQKARGICRMIIKAEYDEQFERMYDYIAELKQGNPGSTFILHTVDHVFDRFYACFVSQKNGWIKACRKMIHLDGIVLEGDIKGEFFTAVGRDANNQVYPIAWAIVPEENEANWEWFLTLLQEDLRLGLGNGLVLFSDKQKGLKLTIEKVCPYADLLQCGSNHLARVFFSGFTECDVVENNMIESFNATINNESDKPIIQILEKVRRFVMVSNAEKYNFIATQHGQITPWAQSILEKEKRESMECQSCTARKGWYEVDDGNTKYKVNLSSDVSCTCRRYEINGIPCAHIIYVLRVDGKGRLPEELVSSWFSYDMWAAMYDENIRPMNGYRMWPRNTGNKVLAPPHRTMPGRPKKKIKYTLKPLENRPQA